MTVLRPLELGLSLPVSGRLATTQNILKAAATAEELGFRSLWCFHRILYPVRPLDNHAFIGTPGVWPKHFRSVLDPLAVLCFVGAHTTRIRLGTAVLNAPFYSPIVLAKELATIDLLTDGRIDVGLGLGWSRDEFSAVGVPYSDRAARFEEFVRCLCQIWADDIVEFDGRFYKIPASIIEPKPVQRPHPPLIFGGFVTAALTRAVKFGQGYVAGAVPFHVLEGLVGDLRRIETENGTTGTRITARGTVRLSKTPHGPARAPLQGDLNEILADVERHRQLGVDELILDFKADSAEHEDTLSNDQLMDRMLLVATTVADAAKANR